MASPAGVVDRAVRYPKGSWLQFHVKVLLADPLVSADQIRGREGGFLTYIPPFVTVVTQ